MILQASPFLSDPAGPSPIVSAMAWIEGTMLGSIATAIAVVCVATVGLMMFSGRIDLRRGLVVVLGCFVVFGASTIVEGFRGAASPANDSPAVQEASYRPVPPPVPIETPPAPPAAYDPYAGASVIRH